MRAAWLTWATPIALFGVAAAIRLAVSALVPFPATEGSAYYVGVARNLLAGEGLVTDALWSYATPPLALPRPAFELWMPMSSFISAAGMSVLGSTYWAAQVASCLVGALLAPLTWGMARTAATSAGLDGRRAGAVAVASGLLVALASPFVLTAAVPDSYTPFVVTSVAAASLVPGILRVGRVPFLRGLAVGLLLGLAYLSRQEAIWLGLSVLVAAWVTLARAPMVPRRDARAAGPTASSTGTASTFIGRLARTAVLVAPIVAGGLVVVLPWLARNASAFGTLFPGQTLENAVLRRNEEIYAFAERPTLGAYLDQGIGTVLGNPLAAAWDGLLNVLVVPAFPVGVAGMVALVVMRRSPAFRVSGALGLLLLSGFLTFATTMLLFPVATRWGTFLHASGPLLVALTVAAAIGGDALLARISAFRRWPKPNVIVAPVGLAVLTTGLLALQVLVVTRQAVALEGRYGAIDSSLESVARARGEPIPDVVISDHPMWLSDALGRAAIALPDEDPGSIGRLASMFDTSWLVVVDRHGRYPDTLLADDGRHCLAEEPVALTLGAGGETGGDAPGWLFVMEPGCGSPGGVGA